MPIFLLAISQTEEFSLKNILLSFIIIHFFVYPSSNGYNSYIDKDEGSIGGLEKPPASTKQLFYFSVILDCLAILASFVLIGTHFAVLILLYIAASRAYSSKEIRLKKYALAGFLVVVFFQGAFTYYMSKIAFSNTPFSVSEELFLLLACSFQIAGAYPLTQVYQHQQDFDDGVLTLSYKLGVKGTFYFTALMFLICNIFYYLYFNSIDMKWHFFLLQLFFTPIVIYFTYWFIKVYRNPLNANFKHTMTMNKISSIMMNIFFTILIILNNFI